MARYPLDDNYIGIVTPSQYTFCYYFRINPVFMNKNSRLMSWGEFRQMYPFQYNSYQYCRGLTKEQRRK